MTGEYPPFTRTTTARSNHVHDRDQMTDEYPPFTLLMVCPDHVVRPLSDRWVGSMSDILDRAEAILTNARSEWAVRDMQAEYALSILSDLVAEIKPQAAYVARLEAAYLDLAASVLWDRTYIAGSNAKEHRIRVEKAAREALEKIRGWKE